MPFQTRAVDNTVSSEWVNPDFAFSLDDQCTTAVSDGDQNVYNIINTPFTIPGGATILGIEVKTTRATDDNDYYEIELQDTAPAWWLKTGTSNLAVCADGVEETLGGPVDDWGGAWTAAHINSANFQIRLTYQKVAKANTPSVDYIEVVVYYSAVTTVPKTWEIDAAFQRLGIERGRGYDAAFQLKGIEKTPTIDTAFLLEGIEKTADLDSLFVLRPELQRQIDAAFQRLGIEKLTDFDTAFQLTVEKTPDFDALFLLRHELLRQVDVAFKRLGLEKTPDFDTAFQLQNIEKTPDFDALFMLRIELLRQLDAVFRATIEKAPDYDVAFQLQYIPKTFDINTLIVLRTELQRTIDTTFQRTIEKTPDFDALFVLRLELARGYDVAFQRLGIERARGYDAAFQLQGIQKTPDFDTAFQLLIEKTPDFDALFVLRVELARGYDAAFQRQNIPRTFGLDVQFGVAVPVAPPPPVTGRPLIWPPPTIQVPFTKRLILLGRIRRLFIQDGRLDVAIRRAFSDEIVFSATAVKRIEEVVSMGGFIVTDDIPDHAWEALFEAVKKEMEEEELVE